MIDDDAPEVQKMPRGFTVENCGMKAFNGHWKQISEANDHSRYVLENDTNSTVDWDPTSATWRMHLGMQVMYSSSSVSKDVPLEGWTFTHQYSPPEITLPKHLPIKV